MIHIVPSTLMFSDVSGSPDINPSESAPSRNVSSGSGPSDRRVHIVPVQRHHAERIQALASDPKVVATTNLPDPYPEEGARQWVEHTLMCREEGSAYAFVIVQDDTVVGATGLEGVTETDAELGYWVGVPYWGQGYATEATRQTVDWTFTELGLQHLYARPLQANSASCRVLEKLGFERGALETHEHPKWSDADKIVRYTLDRAQWTSEETG